eukprot:Sspe_Gene.75823::Locus_47376_Transcript_2_2_Confidence_0.667_Length_1375::g.75823::m.75823
MASHGLLPINSMPPQPPCYEHAKCGFQRRRRGEELRVKGTLYLTRQFAVEMHRRVADRFATSLANQHLPCFLSTRLHTHAPFSSIPLSDGGKLLLSTPNAGGASVYSEVLSFEVVSRIFNASLRATEMEVTYYPRSSPITDYVCDIGEETLGVSVTRAFHYKGPQYYTPECASTLLRKKLVGATRAAQNVVYPSFRRQILHVWVPTVDIARTVQQEYYRLKASVRGKTMVLVTVCSADWIYNEQKMVPKKTKAKKKTKARAPPVPPAGLTRKQKRTKARAQRMKTHRHVRMAVLAVMVGVALSGMLLLIFVLHLLGAACPSRSLTVGCLAHIDDT